MNVSLFGLVKLAIKDKWIEKEHTSNHRVLNFCNAKANLIVNKFALQGFVLSQL